MASLNKVFLMGNLTREPELRSTPGGASVCDFSLAVNRRFSSGGQDREETCFVDIVVWNRQAELCSRYLEKGSSALVEGRLQLDRWEDRETGKQRSRLRVVAERVQFLSRERAAGGDRGDYGQPPAYGGDSYGQPNDYPRPGGAPPPSMPDNAFDIGDEAEDDIPF